MSSPEPQSNGSHSGGKWFEATQWTIILKARDKGAPGAAEALEAFARSYWPPIYRYIRGEGYGVHDAQDLTQGFYVHFLGKQLLNGLGERTGRFRNYLLTCLKHFLSDERDRANAKKRGGDRVIVSLDQMVEEERTWVEALDRCTPEQVFEHRWVQTLMEQTVERLRGEYTAKGRAALFEQLKDIQPGEHGVLTYADIGARLGMSEQAIKNAVHALRRRHREILREEVGQTLTQASETDAEIRHLMAVIAR